MDKLKKIAINLDSNDELSSYRKEFILPTNTIYLDGNSLGVLSKNILDDINNTIKEDWGNNLISSWNDKWIELPNKVSKKIASILNCSGNEVYVGSSTSNFGTFSSSRFLNCSSIISKENLSFMY